MNRDDRRTRRVGEMVRDLRSLVSRGAAVFETCGGGEQWLAWMRGAAVARDERGFGRGPGLERPGYSRFGAACLLAVSETPSEYLIGNLRTDVCIAQRTQRHKEGWRRSRRCTVNDDW